jgi:hypothetical protein
VGAAESTLDVSAPRRIDGEGTIALINKAAEAGVEQFVLVTSLGTGKVGWPASVLNLFWGVLIFKRQAEAALEQSGMSYCIVRPGGHRARQGRAWVVVAAALAVPKAGGGSWATKAAQRTAARALWALGAGHPCRGSGYMMCQPCDPGSGLELHGSSAFVLHTSLRHVRLRLLLQVAWSAPRTPTSAPTTWCSSPVTASSAGKSAGCRWAGPGVGGASGTALDAVVHVWGVHVSW